MCVQPAHTPTKQPNKTPDRQTDIRSQHIDATEIAFRRISVVLLNVHLYLHCLHTMLNEMCRQVFTFGLLACDPLDRWMSCDSTRGRILCSLSTVFGVAPLYTIRRRPTAYDYNVFKQKKKMVNVTLIRWKICQTTSQSSVLGKRQAKHNFLFMQIEIEKTLMMFKCRASSIE